MQADQNLFEIEISDRATGRRIGAISCEDFRKRAGARTNEFIQTVLDRFNSRVAELDRGGGEIVCKMVMIMDRKRRSGRRR